MNYSSSASKFMFVLISIQLLLSATPTIAAATNTISSTKESIVMDRISKQPPNDPKEWALAIGQKTPPAPASLQSIAESTVKQLSAQPSFTSWEKSQLAYFPLGPGTHSWLVTLSTDQQELGYLIFTAKDNHSNEYILSEYGDQSSVPYHLSALFQTLEQSDLISLSSEIAYPSKVEPLYTPLLPIWKITLGGQESIYLNALTLDILPWDNAHFQDLNLDTKFNAVQFSSKEPTYTSSLAISFHGETDPLLNMNWIIEPRLSLKTDLDVVNYLEKNNNLIFTSPNRNDDIGGPFAISGFQQWTSAKKNPSQLTIYAGTGLTGQRYLPLSILRDKGEFRAFPKQQ
ncbi:hypothetical protein [Paenibacillus crassostreae]|uniref:Copper amine oxidase-like N-terminal domain-containing protein n=1 Tax=Paenibacillus crassostreae TaxID=1763538 RepID=A0A167FVU7_9BACL|nr:hypothetical protein [Paenibacillus crassostreae]AOZ94010.1 hypothetical protein LPB68_18685 [Paenibacillus crassostreae]OAB76954.1 hypothetical protein PNBC_06050 [Paenibacillus crassostreae]